MKTRSRRLWCFVKIAVVGALIFNAQAFAAQQNEQWVEFIDVDLDNGFVYMDQTSIRVPQDQPNWREVKVLFQGSIEQLKSFNGSKVMAITINCENLMARNDGVYKYKDPWAKGEAEDVYDKVDDFFKSFGYWDSDTEPNDNGVMAALRHKVCAE